MLSRFAFLAFIMLASIPGIYAGGVVFVLTSYWVPWPGWFVTAPLCVGGGFWVSSLVAVAVLVQASVWLKSPDWAIRDFPSNPRSRGVMAESFRWVVAQVLQLNGLALPPNNSLKRTDQSLRD